MDFDLPDLTLTTTASVTLIAGEAHYERVVEEVLKARHSVWIATANLKELMVPDGRVQPGRARTRGARSHRSVLEVLGELADRGVELRMLHASLPSRAFREAFDAQPALVSGGLELRCCPRVHMKAVIVDGATMYLGSANWTGAGLGKKNRDRRNFELGLVTADEGMIDEVQGLYDHIWRGAACGSCRLRDACEAPLDLA